MGSGALTLWASSASFPVWRPDYCTRPSTAARSLTACRCAVRGHRGTGGGAEGSPSSHVPWALSVVIGPSPDPWGAHMTQRPLCRLEPELRERHAESHRGAPAPRGVRMACPPAGSWEVLGSPAQGLGGGGWTGCFASARACPGAVGTSRSPERPRRAGAESSGRRRKGHTLFVGELSKHGAGPARQL